MTDNVFVLGLDDVNRASLNTLRDAKRYRFHRLLTKAELTGGDEIDVAGLLDAAQVHLESFPGSVDAIVGYWDFPVSLMVPILCERLGLAGPSLDAVLRCEHKYWSRLVQRDVIDEYPAFGVIDVDDEGATLPDGVTYPVWVKPVKSAASEGAFRAESDDDLRRQLKDVRDAVDRMGEPFERILAMVDVPPEVAAIGGRACLVEEASHGDQVTVEGFTLDGDVEIYGVVDSVRHPDLPSFLRFQYPSRLGADVHEYLATVSRAVIGAIGLDRSTFNIEYFWDPDRQRLELLEINPRHSQSHARLFQLVDGLPNHQCMVDLAMGRRPELPRGDGPYDVAAKWFLRRVADGVVRRTPTATELGAIQQDVPGTTIIPMIDAGDRLSAVHGEDSYSYTLAHLYIGARDQQDLEDKFYRCAARLDIGIDDITPPEE